VFRILLEVSEIARDLFEVKLCTCKGLVCMVFKEYPYIMKNYTYSCVIYFSLCGVSLRIVIWGETPWSRQESKHNPTLQFWHLNLILVNTQPHITIWIFKSYCVFFILMEHTWHHICLPFWVWGQWSLFYTWSWLVEGVGLPRSKYPSISYKPVD